MPSLERTGLIAALPLQLSVVWDVSIVIYIRYRYMLHINNTLRKIRQPIPSSFTHPNTTTEQ